MQTYDQLLPVAERFGITVQSFPPETADPFYDDEEDYPWEVSYNGAVIIKSDTAPIDETVLLDALVRAWANDDANRGAIENVLLANERLNQAMVKSKLYRHVLRNGFVDSYGYLTSPFDDEFYRGSLHTAVSLALTWIVAHDPSTFETFRADWGRASRKHLRAQYLSAGFIATQGSAKGSKFNSFIILLKMLGVRFGQSTSHYVFTVGDDPPRFAATEEGAARLAALKLAVEDEDARQQINAAWVGAFR